jgi:putative FmdB family regulatory protein
MVWSGTEIEVDMPIFEYQCGACERKFEAIIRGNKKPSCPHCGGRRLKKLLSAFAVGAASETAPRSPGSCGTCGDPRGPGACGLDS